LKQGRLQTRRAGRLYLWVLVVVLYTVTAWLTPPGFFDGLAPPQPYNWVSPPPAFRSGNKAPSAGELTVKVVNRAVPSGLAFTKDGQARLMFNAGTFSPSANADRLTIQLQPVTDFPKPVGLQLLTNVYSITASAPMAKPAVVTLTYAYNLQPPSELFFAERRDAPWRSLGASGTFAPYTITATTSSLGYFAAGSRSQASTRRAEQRSTFQVNLPLVVGFLLAILALGSLPLVFLARRADDEDTE
jgi:hypothetical protein